MRASEASRRSTPASRDAAPLGLQRVRGLRGRRGPSGDVHVHQVVALRNVHEPVRLLAVVLVHPGGRGPGERRPGPEPPERVVQLPDECTLLRRRRRRRAALKVVRQDAVELAAHKLHLDVLRHVEVRREAVPLLGVAQRAVLRRLMPERREHPHRHPVVLGERRGPQ